VESWITETVFEPPFTTNTSPITVKVAFKVTALLGIMKTQGLVEHEIPVWVDHDENIQPELGVAVTVTVEPTFSPPGQPPGPGQEGATDPVPASTPVIKDCRVKVKVAFKVTALFGITNTQGFVEHEIPV
jgi:hypothetical protein